MKKKRSKRTAFVPTVVFGTAVLGVVPACAIGCGGQSSTTGSVNDAGRDVTFSVAATVFACAFCDGPVLTVAAIGFDSGGEAGSEAGSNDGGDAAIFAVADVAFVHDAGDKG
jgi:hypothetical protein